MISPPAHATAPATLGPAPARRSRFAVRGLRSFGFGVLMALLLTGLGHHALWPNLVYSVCIAMLCWFTIDVGRVPLARWQHRGAAACSPEAASHWPGWPLMIAAIVLCTVVGFSGGHALGRW